MAIYMKIDGISGNVAAKDYNNWIELHGVQWNAARNVGNPIGSGKDRGKVLPYISELVINKQMDETSPNIFLESCKGLSKKVEIHHVKGGDKPEPFLKYILDDVLISSYSVASNAEAIPYETITLNFTKIEMNYVTFDKTTKQNKQIPAKYDLTQISS